MKLFLSFITLYGISIFLWASVGLCRFINEKIEYFRRKEKLDDSIPSGRITLDDVAVLIPAHNEEKTIKDCLEALSKVVPKENIYLGSDGSSDNTVGVVRELDYNPRKLLNRLDSCIHLTWRLVRQHLGRLIA